MLSEEEVESERKNKQGDPEDEPRIILGLLGLHVLLVLFAE